MTLRVIAPGPLATVQDRGRAGFREFGVAAAGAFDREAMAVANSLLGNDPGLTVVELTGFGGTFRAESLLAIALAGAPMRATIADGSGRQRPFPCPGATTIRPGETLAIGPADRGFRAYLAAKGGWRTPASLGSRSSPRPLNAGDLLPAIAGETASLRPSPRLVRPIRDPLLRFLDGPDAGLVDPGWLVATEFRVGASSDRVGLRLEGRPFRVDAPPDRPSSPVAPGTIQVAGGLPIVLGPDCGTMGGYPHVAQVIAADLDRLGQCRPGVAIRFRRVELAVARALDRRRRERLERCCLLLRVAVSGSIPGVGAFAETGGDGNPILSRTGE